MAAEALQLLASLASADWVVSSLDELASRSDGGAQLATSLRLALSPPAAASSSPPSAPPQLAAAHCVCDALWRAAQEGAGWEAPVLREAFVLACAAAATHELASAGAARTPAAAAAALRSLDRAFVMGGPSELLQPFVDVVEPLVTPPLCDEITEASELGGEAAREADPTFIGLPVATAPSSLSRKEFKSRFYDADVPVVVAGGAAAWRSLSEWRRPCWWVSHFGHRTVPLEVGAPGTPAWREELDTVAGLMRCICMSPPAAAAAPCTDQHEVVYLAQHTLFDQLPSLRGGAWPPPSCVDPRRVTRTNAWIGSANTVTPLHYDSYDGAWPPIWFFTFLLFFFCFF